MTRSDNRQILLLVPRRGPPGPPGPREARGLRASLAPRALFPFSPLTLAYSPLAYRGRYLKHALKAAAAAAAAGGCGLPWRLWAAVTGCGRRDEACGRREVRWGTFALEWRPALTAVAAVTRRVGRDSRDEL